MKTIYWLFLGGLTSLAASIGAAAFPELLFEENLGQSEAGVRYVARAQGHTVFLRGDDVVFAPPAGAPVRLQFPGARVGRWEAIGTERDTISYFTGSDPAKWVRGARQFGRVAWREAYPGIDIVFHSAGRRLEYDFVVKPGADPRAVRLRFVGAEARLEADGAIAAGVVRQRAPRIYDTNGKTVAGRFVSNRTGEFLLELGAYDRNAELTVDPIIETYAVMGGENDDEIKVVTDTFVAGNTRSVAFVDGQAGRRRSRDVFVRGLIGPFFMFGSRESFFGTAVYGGSDDDEIGGAAAGNTQFVCILAGTTKSTDLPLATNTYFGGASDGFAVRIRAFGSFGRPELSEATYLGGSGEDRIHAVAWNNNSLYAFAGVTDSTDLNTTGALWSVPGGGKNVFAGLLSMFGSNAWSIGYLGGDGDDAGHAVTFSATGQVVIGGETSSSNFPFTDRDGKGRSGPSDGFLTTVTTNSMFDQSRPFPLLVTVPFSATSYLIGGDGADSVRALAAATTSRAIDQFDRSLRVAPAAQTGIGFAGVTTSADLATRGAFQAVLGGGSDGFAGVWETSRREPRWVSYVGGSGEDSVHGAAMNWFGDLIIGGWTASSDLPLVDAAQKAPGGGEDGLFAMFERGGGVRHVTFWGGSGDDRIYAVSTVGGRTARAGGVTNSPGFRPGVRNYDESEGGAEGFVASIGSHYFSGPDELILPKDGAQTLQFRSNITQLALPITYRSADPSKVRVVRFGTSSAEATMPAEDGVLVEAMTDSGEVELIISAPEHREKVVRVRLYPGVFEIFAPPPPVSLIAGGTALNTLIQYSAYDEAAGRTLATAGLRPGIRMPNVQWRSSDPDVLSVNPTAAGGLPIFVSATTNRPGEARLTAEVEGFRVLDGPVYSVRPYQFRLMGASTTAAKGLQGSLPFTNFPVRSIPLTAKSGDPSKVLLATPTMRDGAESASIVFRDSRQGFGIYALADSGEVPITVSGPDLESDAVFLVKLEPAAVRCGLMSFQGLSLEDIQISAGRETSFGCQTQGANSGTPGSPIPGAPTPSFELENSDPAILELGSIYMDLGRVATLRGIAAGTASIRARETSGTYRIENETVPVRVTEAVVEVRAPKTVEIGKDLQSTVGIQVVNVPGPVELTVTSSDPSALLVSDSERATGSAQMVLRRGGSGENQLWLQGLKSSGTATVTVRYASAPPQTIEVSLLPSAIAATGPSGAASIAAGYDLLLAVSPFVVDDATGRRLAQQLLRPGLTVEARLRVEGAGARLSTDTVQIGASGVAYLSAAYPPAGQEAEIVVSGSGEFGEAAVASRFRLRRPGPVTPERSESIAVAENTIQPYLLQGVNNTGMSVASGDPARLLLSLRPDSEPLPRIPSVTSSQTIYLHGLASSGAVDLTIFAGDEARRITRVLLQPLGIGIGGFVPPSPTAPPTRLTVGVVGTSLLRNGVAPFGVTFRSSDERVFRVSPDRATLRPGEPIATVTLTPVARGTAEFIVTPDDGAPVSGRATMQVVLREPQAEPREILLGKNLQLEVPIRLTDLAPASGAILTVTSTDPSKVLVSRANAPGTASAVVAVAAGAMLSQPLYVQALSDSGVVALRVTGTGLAESTIPVRLAPTRIVFNSEQEVPALAGASTQVGVRFAVEGAPANPPPNYAGRAGGPVARVRISSSNPAVAEPVGEVTVPGFLEVRVKAVGVAALRIETSEGFAETDSSMSLRVPIPFVRASCAQGIFLGKDTQLTCTIESPTGTTFTATSLHPSLAVVGATADAAGSAQATVTRSFTVQALASRGTTEIVLTAPGVEPTRIPVVLRPVRLAAFSTRGTGPNQLLLFPGENNEFRAQISVAASNSSQLSVRAGARMMIGTEFSAASVASITPAQIELNGGETSKVATIRGLAAGTTLLRVRPPEGVELESQPLQITVR